MSAPLSRREISLHFLLLHLIFQTIDRLTFIAAAAPTTAQQQIDTKPRGVLPQLASFYQEREHFQCLDGNKTIQFDYINDDYCDCTDGSDEPGTAACRNGRFYCPNFGYKPLIVPSSRVNDFICDCCDGSDEWDSGVECPNTCEEQGSKAREESRKRKKIYESGWTKRLELAKEGQKMLNGRRIELEQKKKELEELQELKLDAEAKKAEAEQLETEAKRIQDEQWEIEKSRKQREEAKQMMQKMDTDGDEKLTAEELKKYAGYEKIQKEAEQQILEQILKDIFPEDITTLDVDLLVEKLFKVRDFLTRSNEALAANKSEEEPENNRPEELKGDESKNEENTLDEQEGEAHPLLDDEGKESTADGPGPQYDDETRQLIKKADEARKQFNEIQRKVDEIQEEIRESEKFLEFEYGLDQVWAPLKGECAEMITTQYTYKICLFDKTVQKDRSGYSEVNLGYWGSWIGPNWNKFLSQKYDHGQSCWNGPERSTLVEFECGIEFELVETSEPSKCEYKFKVKAPAACQNPEELEVEHSEL